MIRFGVQELEPPGGGSVLCPILPLTVEDFSRAAAIVTPPPGAPEDAIYEGPVVRAAQEALNAQGITCPVNGYYTNMTRGALAEWVQRKGVNTRLGSVGPRNVTTCAVWRSLGITCRGLEVVRDVTPQAEYIWRLIEHGTLSLTCPAGGGPVPGAPIPNVLKWLLIGGVLVVAVWVYKRK